MKSKGRSKGLTLIGLIVTIIIILILASVTIVVLTGENGIIGLAQKASEEYEKAAKDETEIMNFDLLAELLKTGENMGKVETLHETNYFLSLMGLDGGLSFLADPIFGGDPGQAISTVFAENHLKTITLIPANSSTANVEVIIDIHYDLQLLDPNAYYPPGTLSIQVPAPDLNTTSTTFQYDTSAGDAVFEYKTGNVSKSGFITITNHTALNSTVSGNIKVRFRVPVRACVVDVNGNIIYTGMKAKLVSTAPGYAVTREAGDLTFTIPTTKDNVAVTKTPSATSIRPQGLGNLPSSIYNGNIDDYFFVDYRVYNTNTSYTREIVEIELSDAITGGTLVQVKDTSGAIIWYTGQTAPAGFTINGTTYKYTSTTTYSQNVYLTVMYKKSDYPRGQALRIYNTFEAKARYESSTTFDTPKTVTSNILVDTYHLASNTGTSDRFATNDYMLSGRLGYSTGTGMGFGGWKQEDISTSLQIYDGVYWGKHYEGYHGNIEITLELPQAKAGTTLYTLTPADIRYSTIQLKPVPGCSKISVWGIGTETGTTWQLIQDNINSNNTTNVTIPTTNSYRIKVIYHNPSQYIDINKYTFGDAVTISNNTCQIIGTIRLTATGVSKIVANNATNFQTFHSMDCVDSTGVGHITKGTTPYSGDSINLGPIQLQIHNKYRYWHNSTANITVPPPPTADISYTISMNPQPYKFNGTSKYYENTLNFPLPSKGSNSIALVAADLVCLLPDGIEYIPNSHDTGIQSVTTINNFNGTGRQLVIMKNAGTGGNTPSIKTRIKDINIYNGINTINFVSYLVITNPNSTAASGTMAKDTGTLADSWPDLNQNGTQNEYAARTTGSASITRTLDSNAQAIKTQVKTRLMSNYGTSGEDAAGGTFIYRLSVSTLSNQYKDVVLYNVLPHIGDTHYNGSERGSEANVIFVDVDISEAQAMGYNPTVYYSTSGTPGTLTSGLWTTVRPVNLEDIKAVAFDFGTDEFPSDSVIPVYIYVKTDGNDLTLIGKKVYNSFYYEKKHNDDMIVAWVQDPILETSIIEMTFSEADYGLSITKRLAPGQSSKVQKGDTVNYIIKVTNTGALDLTNVIVTDNLDLGWIKTISLLPANTGNPGDTAYYKEFAFSYQVPTTATQNQVINNIASAVSDEIVDPVTAQRDVTVKLPDYTIEKKLKAGQDPVFAGDTVTYQITVTNTGGIDLHNLVITDSLNPGWSYTLDTLYAEDTQDGICDYFYSGTYEEFIAPQSGTYKLEVWGAQGGVESISSGQVNHGGYSKGEIYLTAGEKLYVYVGGRGNIGGRVSNVEAPGGFNGGGKVTATSGTSNSHSGGGATDIRLLGGTWDNTAGLYSRIIVAGGAGAPGTGNNWDTSNANTYGTYGGSTGTRAGTQSNPGSISPNPTLSIGGFGYGASSINTTGDDNSAGGGGWYGGGSNGNAYGGGGSNYVLTSTSYKPVGYNVNSKYYLSNTVMKAGNELVPKYNGVGTMTGNAGDGHAKITFMGETQELKLAKGQAEIEFTYTVPITTPNGKVINNVVTAICDEITTPKTDSENMTVLGPEISIEKTLKPGQKNPVEPGDIVEYIIKVINTGEVDLNNVIVTDNLDPNWEYEIELLSVGDKIYEFEYNGDYEEFIVPYNGVYRLEVWGAEGGRNYGGLGGYSKGEVYLEEGEKLYIYVGGEGFKERIQWWRQ